jgi:gamma-glutamyltranspeptidase / glutathione hydrolase
MRYRISMLVLLLVAYQTISIAASPRPAWAEHAMVSSAEPMATEVGVDILRNGGNAVDAAVGVALALGVTEGYSSGIGGGCFIVARLADGTSITIDGRETAPAKASRLMFVPKDSSQESNSSTLGVLAPGTPGELAALDLALRKYGTKSLAEVLEGPIALADTGFDIGLRYDVYMQNYAPYFAMFEGTKAIYFKNDTATYRFGDRFVQKDLAATLTRIRNEGIDAFYQGDIPETVGKYVKANGGVLSAKDFELYKPVEREPIRGTYRGMEIIAMPPPSSGGIHVIQILNLLEDFDLKHLGAGSSDAIHLISEAMQIAFADRAEFLGDPDFVNVPTQGLLSPAYADQQQLLITRLQHKKLDGPGNPQDFLPPEILNPDTKHTTHLSVIDDQGNAVAITATINTPFGCGVIVPGTGFFLNNEMDDFVTWPGRANYFGLVGKEANEIEPGKRPLSSMSPTILVRDGKPFMVVGGAGGPRIITGTVLAIINAIDFGMTLQEAVDFPRFHNQWMPDYLFLEQEYTIDVQRALRDMRHNVISQTRWAAVNAVSADTLYGGFWGAADSRAQGMAKGY